MFCKNCGKKLAEESKFCDHCGEKVEEEKNVYCTYCGKEIDKDASICPYCSKKVVKESSSSLDFQTKILCIFSFLIPFMGLILWIVVKGENEEKARNIANCSLMGFLFWIFYNIIF